MDERMTFVLSGQYSSLFTIPKLIQLWFYLLIYDHMFLSAPAYGCGCGEIVCELIHFLNNRCEIVSGERIFG